MKKVLNVVRLLGPLGLSLVWLSGCPSNTAVTHSCDAENPCPPGFNCTEKICKESLSCEVLTRGAPNPARNASPKAKDDECRDTKECATGLYCDKFDDVCKEIRASGAACGASAECPAGEYCKDQKCVAAGCGETEFCREGVDSATCVTAGCRSSSECTGGLKCIDSECKDPPSQSSAASCVITNLGRAFAEGATIEVNAVAMSSGSEVLPFLEYTLASDNEAAFKVNAGTKTITAQTAGTGQAVITATFGSVSCAATFHHAGGTTPAAGFSRVVLHELSMEGEPVPVTNFVASDFRFADENGNSIEANPATFVSGLTNGVYLMQPLVGLPGLAQSLNIVHDGYNPTTIVFSPDQVADVMLPLERLGETSGFGGEPSFTAFDTEFPSLAKAEIGAVYSGGSLPLTSLLHFSLDLFTGDTAPKKIDATILTSGSSGTCTIVPNGTTAGEGEFPLPRALYAQLGAGKIGVNCDGQAVRVIPGRRKPWSIGAKLRTSDISDLVPVITSASGTNIGVIIGAVLPFFDNFAIGNESLGDKQVLKPVQTQVWDGFKDKSPAQMRSLGTFPVVTTSPARRLKFVTNFSNPGIVTDIFPDATASDKMSAFIATVGAVSKAYGIVPLGFGAGFDDDGDGQLESLSPTDTERFPANHIHARHAAPSSDLSDADLVAVSVALNLDDLVSDTPKNGAIRVKGMVARDKGTGIGWNIGSPSLGNFEQSVKAVNWANTAVYALGVSTSLVNNTLTLPPLGMTSTGAEADVIVVRVSRTGGSRYWNVIMNPGKVNATGTSVKLSTMGFDGGTTDVVCSTCPSLMSFTSTTLDVKNAGTSFATRFGPAGGKDLDAIAGDTQSFTLYSQDLERAP